MKDPQWRRYAKLLIAGKMLEQAVLAGLILGGRCILDMLRRGTRRPPWTLARRSRRAR